MPVVSYPPELSRRVLAHEAPGSAPVVVSLVAPTIAAAGRPFALKLAVLDGSGLPSVEFDGAVVIENPGGGGALAEVCFSPGRPAVAWVAGVTLPSEGLCRFTARLDHERFPANPTMCRRDPVEAIYWGDPHVHTVLSNCHAERCRSLNFCYTAARYLSGLDWVAAADHVSNGRCDFSKWKEQGLVRDLYDDPPEFVTLPAYEASLRGGAGGDINVYMLRQPVMFVDEYEDGNARTLAEKLGKVLPPAGFFLVPHHTTRTGKHGETSDDIYPGPERMPAVEVHSQWGTSEYRGNPNPLQKIHPGPSYAVDLLGRGLTLGFMGGTDTHATMPSGTSPRPRGATSLEPGHIDRLPGLTAVRAAELTRETVFHALGNRRCYATSLERIYLDGAIAGLRFGQIGRWCGSSEPREITALAAAQSEIVSIELIRNGEVIHTGTGTGWQMKLTHTDEDGLARISLNSKHLGRFVYYYVRVRCASGAQAWGSPVWLIEG